MVDRYDDEDSYVGRMMMELSGELMTFSVGGPRFFENNSLVECFEQWSGHNLANTEYLVEIYRDCPKVYGYLYLDNTMKIQPIPGG